MTETDWDHLLKIKTTGRDDSHADQYRYPYEPTPYAVLERLANSGFIGRDNVILDYGCGKGRVSFFLAYQCRCLSIGVEYDERIYESVRKNQMTAVSGQRVHFFNAKAENYDLSDRIDRIFFFNPFSVEILQSVLGRIRESWYANPRELLLFFYYPSDEYISCLMHRDEFMFVDEIDCQDLFKGTDERERIMIFEMG